MKVKIKGLVFVGFAAAILSANAMAAADDNIVTSKSYVDAKIVDNVTGDNENKAPSQLAVKTALGTKQDKDNTQVYKVGYNGDWEDANSAVSVTPTSGTAYLTKTDNQNGSVTLNVNATTDTSLQSANSGGADENKIPTAGAVKAYVDAHSATSNFVEDAVTDSVTNKAPTENAVYDFVTIRNVTANGSALSVDSSTKTVNIPVMSGSDGTNSGVAGLVPTSLATDQNKVLTAGGTWVAKQNEQSAQDTFQVSKNAQWANISSAVSGDNAYVATSSDATTGGVKVELTNVTASYDATNWNSAGSTDNLTTEAAVYGAIQAATGGTTIPAQNPGVCTASTPCALVAEYNSTNTAMELHWRTMATATDSGGVLGDAQ